MTGGAQSTEHAGGDLGRENTHERASLETPDAGSGHLRRVAEAGEFMFREQPSDVWATHSPSLCEAPGIDGDYDCCSSNIRLSLEKSSTRKARRAVKTAQRKGTKSGRVARNNGGGKRFALRILGKSKRDRVDLCWLLAGD